jgi:hypothetical protein
MQGHHRHRLVETRKRLVQPLQLAQRVPAVVERHRILGLERYAAVDELGGSFEIRTLCLKNAEQMQCVRVAWVVRKRFAVKPVGLLQPAFLVELKRPADISHFMRHSHSVEPRSPSTP